ncbi:MAG: glycosyl transferase group 1 [uncultured bacterium]|nr:MAG: glycosyl transferase group 1 [uncultured bacterium]
MRIGINASFLRKPNTGIGQVTANFIKKLIEISNDGKNEYILYLEEDVDFELPTNFSKKVFLPKMYKRDDIIRAIWWQKHLLPKFAKKDGCDIFFSLFQCATIMPKNMKHIMLVHDVLLEFFPQYLNNWRKKYFWRLSKKAIKKSDKIIAVSHRTEKDLIQQLGIDPAKISVSHVDVDDIYKKEVDEKKSEEVLNEYGIKRGYIYTGGGLDLRKNTESVLRAYKILLKSYGRASWLPRLVISGKMMPELAPLIADVEAIVQGLELEKEVDLLGFVQQADLPALYKNASVFVYPSLYEGFGLPVLEAMNQGIAVITSKKSSLPEVGSDAVLYCNPSDVDDLAMVLRNVLTNDHLRSRLATKGKERALHFSWDKFVHKFLNIIKEEKNAW